MVKARPYGRAFAFSVRKPLRWVFFDSWAPACGPVSPLFCGKTAGHGVFPRRMSVEKQIKKTPGHMANVIKIVATSNKIFQ